jgi:hypothetical protein
LEKTERAIKNEQSRETFLDRGLLLTRKLLSPGFSLAKMKSSLRTFYGHYHDLITVTEYGFVTRVKRRMPLVEEQLPTLAKLMSSLPVLVGFVLLDL